MSLWPYHTLYTLTKTYFFIFLTWYNRLGANMYAYPFLSVSTRLVCSSQSNLNEHLDHPFFSLMLRSAPIKPSHTFFSTCITFIQCLTSNLDQYERSKKIDFFFQMFLTDDFLLNNINFKKYKL